MSEHIKEIIWKDLINFETKYQISNDGDIKSKTTNMLLKNNIMDKRNAVQLYVGNEKMSTNMIKQWDNYKINIKNEYSKYLI